MTDNVVYIPDLPVSILGDDADECIKNRIETVQRMELKDVKCYVKLGVAVLQMSNQEDKNQLVSNVESMVFDKKRGMLISFVDNLELDTYIVLDQTVSKIPSPQEVAQRYAKAFKSSTVPTCESISVQFPNIFRIFPKTLDELDKTTDSPDFKIDSGLATVYPLAECNFFEDLPPSTNTDKITSAIATQIGESRLPSTAFYVQCNKQTRNAVVIASRSIKKWMTDGHLEIDGQSISKKAKLAYRLIVSPVPRDFSIDKILRHKLFAGRIASHKHIDESLVLEFDSLEDYNYCLEIGALRVNDVTLNIKPHAAVSDPDESELDAVNWYETAMLDMKPNIVTVINNLKHPIFRYQWNAENWIQQMRKAETSDRRSGKFDLTKHLLRVTVMLNTIGVLTKKKYVVDGKEVRLDLQRMRTIGYNNQSKLTFQKKISQNDFKTLYPRTTVKVVNEDCLVLYEKLASEGRRPVLLNMANATSPGGGYRKGDGAQEENVFRRSDYYHSLDGEIAEKDRSERLHCTQKCEFKSMKGFSDFYPMEEFGAIYTSGITAFRYSEDKGYAYMKDPLRNVCAIAMAAYRDPPLTKKNTLEKKPAINTHRKIQSIFAIAHHQKHDCLVLSALGCGAFKNPPKHVALLFKSVIYQYAGYFDTIYFAIIDDHNTGNAINPHGNFRPFAELLDGLVVEPPKALRVNGVTGPHRILEKTTDGQLTLGDACISYLPLCQHGTDCRELRDANHNREFSHPPMCSLQDTHTKCDQMDDEVHMFTFIHIMKCKHGGECTSKDPAHFSEYDHPEFCKDESHCNNSSSDHLFAFRHLPPCRYGIECSQYLKRDPDHMKSYRHCKSVCPNDNCCIDFHDEKHCRNATHSFRPPCPFTPYNCLKYVEFIQKAPTKKISQEIEEHCLRFSHICPHGRQCRTTDDKHYELFIHIARQPCAEGTSCSKIGQEDHLESFSHPDIRDIRLFCREPGFRCPDRYTSGHFRKFRHGQNHNYLNVAPSSNLNSEINFVENQKQLIRTVNAYVDAASWKKAKVSEEVLNWIRALQPVHRCNPAIFESILVHGHVMSRHYMKYLEKPKKVAKAVMQHSRVRLIFLKHHSHAVKESAFEYIVGLVNTEFSKTGMDGITAAKLDPDHEEQINTARQRLKAASLSSDDLKVIDDWTVKIAQASIALHGAPMGIGFGVDEKMGTDKHIFSILGPHYGYYYGDIIITFKQEIMFHPDANFSIQAATSFSSGRTYKQRPWIKDQGTDETHVEDFHNSKLHCSVPRYEYAAATELMALSGKDKQSMDVNLSDVIQRWINADSHFVFEGHLPQLIPLDYIDCVYIPQNVFQSLSPETQQSAKNAFHSLIITSHTIDPSITPTMNTPLDPSRIPYQKHVLDKIDEKIKERMNKPRISRGIVITVPGSRFAEHIVLPITISQSYKLYCLDKSQAPHNPEYTYIYWQAMHGDMMLTIASQKLQSSGKDQSNLRCLVCYVAEKPSAKREKYHEEYSYLNDGHPLRHEINVNDGRFRAKSDVFYRGCNTDDFLTFCLKISHKTNEVTLSHAGPNGIYNHEKISFRFDKSDLDLSRIEHVHVSGGKQDVPIRNLTINHEPVSELHPSFDKDFKIDTSTLLGRRRASVGHIPRADDKGGASDKGHSGPSEARRPRASSVQPPPPPPPEPKPSIFARIKNKLFGPSPKDDSPAPAAPEPYEKKPDVDKTESPEPYKRRDKSPPRRQQRSQSPKHDKPRNKSPTLISSKLPPCNDSIYCLNQNTREHTDRFSHPCRFNEVCRRMADEPHLVHQHHKVSKCSDDRDCRERTDAVHRAKFRHSGLPDFLVPCRHQEMCYDKTPEHRIKYSHGEEIPSFKSKFCVHIEDICLLTDQCF